jgi:hypothetical protein
MSAVPANCLLAHVPAVVRFWGQGEGADRQASGH